MPGCASGRNQSLARLRGGGAREAGVSLLDQSRLLDSTRVRQDPTRADSLELGAQFCAGNRGGASVVEPAPRDLAVALEVGDAEGQDFLCRRAWHPSGE